MSYIYDILLNFKQELYEFYDWNTSDSIIHVRKIPLFLVSSQTINDLKNFVVKIDDNFLKKVKDKTEIFQNKHIVSLPTSFLLSDGLEVIALLINDNQIKISRLLVEEELEVLDEVQKLKEDNFDYKKIKKRYVQTFKTRKDMKMEQYLKKELKKLEKEDILELQYLYYECFLEEETDRKKIIDRFYQELNNNFSFIASKLLSFFKLVH